MKTSKTGICQICKKEYKLNQLMPAYSIRNSLTEFIVKEVNDWNPGGYICIKDLNTFRGKFIGNIIEEGKGELSKYDKEVLQSIVDRELISENVDNRLDQKESLGARLSDKIAKFGGSWGFIISFFLILVLWMAINIILLSNKGFDPYPFILLNLVLSCLAAIQAPIIMMSQNRQEEKDRERALHDYQVNLKAEIEIRQLHEKIDHILLQQGQKLIEIQEIQMEMMEEISNKIKKS